jgi:hypothetical protein
VQVSSEFAPRTVENVPSLHEIQVVLLVAAVIVEYVPAIHGIHTLLAVALIIVE